MRISCLNSRHTPTRTAFEKKHYRFCFPRSDETLIARQRALGGIPCHPPPISFFLIHHFFPSSLFSDHLAVLSLHPFFYIFVDVYCFDAVRHKSHYLRIVGSGTRLRGQRDTDERGFPRYLESLPPYFHRHRFAHSHKATRFSEKPFARISLDNRSPRLFHKRILRGQESSCFRVNWSLDELTE